MDSRERLRLAEEPVLRKMNNFKCMDAILDLSDPANPKEPEWPKVDFIVGNPPFLGGSILRNSLGDAYVEKLFATYGPEFRTSAIFAAIGLRTRDTDRKREDASEQDCSPRKASAAAPTAKS